MRRHHSVQKYAQLPPILALVLFASSLLGSSVVYADGGRDYFFPGNLLVSRTVYDNNPNNVTVGEPLPPNCVVTSGSCSPPAAAISNGSYPQVFNNCHC
jgi:hypothetical protein